ISDFSGPGPTATLRIVDPNSIIRTVPNLPDENAPFVTVDRAGNVYFTAPDSASVKKLDRQGGVLTTIAGNGFGGYSGDGGPATAAEIGRPSGIAVDGDANLYVGDLENNVIRKISSDGTINRFAGIPGPGGFGGDGGDALDATLHLIRGGLALDAAGDLYIADTG